MAEAGLMAIAIAKQNSSWEALDSTEALVISEDLELALLGNEAARQNFYALGKSKKKYSRQSCQCKKNGNKIETDRSSYYFSVKLQ